MGILRVDGRGSKNQYTVQENRTLIEKILVFGNYRLKTNSELAIFYTSVEKLFPTRTKLAVRNKVSVLRLRMEQLGKKRNGTWFPEETEYANKLILVFPPSYFTFTFYKSILKSPPPPPPAANQLSHPSLPKPNRLFWTGIRKRNSYTG